MNSKSVVFKRPKGGVESAIFSNMPTGPVDIYKVKPSESNLLVTIENNMMSWNLTSKKSSTPTEYGVWKLLSCSFTNQSQKNPFPLPL